jgi:DNA-binding MarR family transcriptional regulator
VSLRLIFCKYKNKSQNYSKNILFLQKKAMHVDYDMIMTYSGQEIKLMVLLAERSDCNRVKITNKAISELLGCTINTIKAKIKKIVANGHLIVHAPGNDANEYELVYLQTGKIAGVKKLAGYQKFDTPLDLMKTPINIEHPDNFKDKIYKEKNDYIYNKYSSNIKYNSNSNIYLKEKIKNKMTNPNFDESFYTKIGKNQIDALKANDLSSLNDEQIEMLVEFMEHRKLIKKPMTHLAVKRCITNMGKLPVKDVQILMDKAIMSSWIDWYYPDALPKVKPEDRMKNNATELLKEIRGF